MAKTAMDLVLEAKAVVTEIDIDKADAMLAKDIIALDVRDELEYAAGHLPDARHITRGMLEFKIADHADFQNKSKSIIVYCKTGMRSLLAAATLQEMGFTDVRSMIGGFDNWQAAGKRVSQA